MGAEDLTWPFENSYHLLLNTYTILFNCRRFEDETKVRISSEKDFKVHRLVYDSRKRFGLENMMGCSPLLVCLVDCACPESYHQQEHPRMSPSAHDLTGHA